MDICSHCGNPILIDHSADIDGCFDNIQGELGRFAAVLPQYHHWSYMRTYKNQWTFLPFTLQDRIAEQLMAFGYIWSLADWLQPNLILGQRQKVIAVTTLGSVYEGVLAALVEKNIKSYVNDEFFNQIRRKPQPGWQFSDLVRICRNSGFISEQRNQYLTKIREVRNWIHVSGSQKPELQHWLNEQSYPSLQHELQEFRQEMQGLFESPSRS